MSVEPQPSAAVPLCRRCPRLGGPVTFGYCMGCEQQRPCPKVTDCWWETFDIVRYLQEHLPADQVEHLLRAQPKPKIVSLVELIAEARKRVES
ncbi:MAG: hypothetical protein MUD16_18690 [Desulfobacterales bacterium]|jgi:hypothetical protein|nr:hypothetical protein [Desulfobacterales bacterium]